ncbi:hypothetical protein [Halogeometricum limi]|uniref:DUF8135 domain-containing protein n=1 Tax=Halogeometricum limi TaxID=555875 RepID=A0A1I6HKP1_9EURY|nr:hypothetical protein [Halogeometricum limi]SFR55043.1 hypothetical protein SAMN04488124_2350 [Halogeometricum limi]
MPDENETEPVADSPFESATIADESEPEAAADDARNGDARGDDANAKEDADDGDEPLAELAARIERRRNGDDGPAGAADSPPESPFETMAVEAVDTDSLWTELAGESEQASGVGVGEAARTAGEDSRGNVDHVVSKRAFCQQCPHFTDPPELACGHDRTSIVEVVDADHFRVRNCPMVDD